MISVEKLSYILNKIHSTTNFNNSNELLTSNAQEKNQMNKPK
jgi:hypothetical protein